MLLEEAALFLLARAGYRTISSARSDPTLRDGSAGIEVCGRGGQHQIDAVADSLLYHPFSYPQRLLVEAKCLAADTKVSIPVARAAVGILKDVNEFWETRVTGGIPKQRYHYQYALFSATEFTSDTELYAFAHDIYLFPVADSAFFRPVVRAIRNVTEATNANGGQAHLELKLLRRHVRRRLQQNVRARDMELFDYNLPEIEQFLAACRELRFALMTVLGARFPVFLVPSPAVLESGLRHEYLVRIFRDESDSTWYLRDPHSNQNLFSFDLPRKLFLEYATEETLTDEAALDLKQQNMSRFHAYHVRNGSLRLITFRIDKDWLQEIRHGLTVPS